MKQLILILWLCTITLFANSTHSTHQADSHAPIGIMSDHGHTKDEIMVSYRFMSMQMNDLYSGQKKINDASINTTMTPLDMQMNMHMIGAMWGFSNNITLLGMINYSDNSMNMSMMGNKSTMETKGLNDLKIGALYTIKKTEGNTFLAHTKLSIPLGSVDENTSDKTTPVPYGMQLGSGTFDIELGSTYTKTFKDTSIGIQSSSTFRLGKNKHDYALGNKYQITAWGQKNWTTTFSTNIKSTTAIQGNIQGEHKGITAMTKNMSPLYTTEQGYILSSIGIGANYINNSHLFTGSRLAIEYSIPIFRKTNAINFSPESTLTFGIQHVL
jgi:outer membrane receptor for ferric coprogen and ferric-rhodotorulic acid